MKRQTMKEFIAKNYTGEDANKLLGFYKEACHSNYVKNKEYHKEYYKKYYQEHKEVLQEYHKKYWQEHKEEINKRRKEKKNK